VRYIITLLVLGLICLSACQETSKPIPETQIVEEEEPPLKFGLLQDDFKVIDEKVKSNQFLADIMLDYGIGYPKIQQMVDASNGVMDFRKMKKGDRYSVFCTKDSSAQTCYFVYQPNQIEYIVFDLRDSVTVKKGEKEVSRKMREIKGRINSSLYEAFQDQGVSTVLALKLSEIYAWSIDFYRIQKGDSFYLSYNELIVEEEAIGVAEILSSKFVHRKLPFYAFRYQYEENWDYFDEEGRSLRKAFLQAPLKFGRISSGFTNKRFHPVQKRWKAHLGTDYAAPKGTPIIAVGDGTITDARFGKYNGRYVKIKHNGTYTTQYLHMSGFAKGIRAGKYVKQGDVIGYVGSTGLATGPHVCFRFWKNGKQVNHRQEKIPPSKPVKEEDKADYMQFIQPKLNQLNSIGNTSLPS